MTLRNCKCILQRQLVAAMTLGRLLLAGVLDQNFAHEMRANRKEVCSISNIEVLIPHEAEVGLVHERAGLQRMAGSFLTQVVVCQTAKIVVDERNDAVQTLLVTGSPPCQQLGDRLNRGFRHIRPQVEFRWVGTIPGFPG